MRSVLLFLALLVILAAAALTQQQQPAQAEPVRIAKVRDNLYFIRGPATIGADGLPHEPGDVALRVTPEGIIMIETSFSRTCRKFWNRSAPSPHSRLSTSSTRTATPITPAAMRC